ncbi:MAG: hypothetical protein AVDCRST_MAG03-2016, partial [uncultured Rubrobacteraceae bacterium]
ERRRHNRDEGLPLPRGRGRKLPRLRGSGRVPDVEPKPAFPGEERVL